MLIKNIIRLNKKITVVVVTFNGEIWIRKNLDSLLKSTYPIAIIVVDNASTDQSVVILNEYKNIQLVENKTNLGFGKANNIGIDLALKNGSDAVFLLNQDTWVFENTVSALVDTLFQNPNFGIVSPVHLSADGVTFDGNFNTYYSKYESEINSKSIRIVPFVNAAAWLVSAACFQKAGYFEPHFNHYGEDRNFCDRLKFHQFKIGVAKEAAICHDRIVKLSTSKIQLQSQYLIFNQLINCNYTFLLSTILGLKFVFGLPKFHFKSQGFVKSFQLFCHLLRYYFILQMDIQSIKQIRFNSKMGINGIYIQN